jgi:hypothetical protein
LVRKLGADGNGLIPISDLIKFLETRNFFCKEITVEGVVSVLNKLMNKENVDATKLIRFINGFIVDQSNQTWSTNEDDFAEECYQFSSDPEVRLVEKKLKAIGSILVSQNVDVPEIFSRRDLQNVGWVSRADFLEILSEIGVSILEIREHEMKKLGVMSGDREKLQLDSLHAIKNYRLNQKHQLLKRVMSNSILTEVDIFPRFVNHFTRFLFDNFNLCQKVSGNVSSLNFL